MATELNMSFDDGAFIVNGFKMDDFLCEHTRRKINEYCSAHILGASEYFAMQAACQASSTRWDRLYNYPTTLAWKRSYCSELSKLSGFKLGVDELELLKDCYSPKDVNLVAKNMRAVVYGVSTGALKIDYSDVSMTVIKGPGIHWIIYPLKSNIRDVNDEAISNLKINQILDKLLFS